MRLVTDVRRVAMSGVYDGYFGEDEQLLLYGLYELCIAAVGKVGTADGALKQCVAGKEYAALLGIETHASCRMARRGDAPQCFGAEREDATLMQRMPYGAWHGVGRYAEAGYGLCEISNPRTVLEACAHTQPVGVLNECSTEDVVKVQVRAEQVLHMQPVLFDELTEPSLLLVPIHPRVYYGCLVRLLIVHYVAVLVQHIANECLYFHGTYIFDIPCEGTLFINTTQ